MAKFFLAAFLSVLMAQPSFAHSPLKGIVPADGAVVQAPDQIALSFGRPMRLTRLSWTRDDGGSGDLDLAGQSDFSTEFILAFPLVELGEYAFTWRGLSNDGHPQTGTFSFTVN